MRGGRYEYDQYRIRNIVEYIESEIEKNGRKKTDEEIKDESWNDKEWYEKYPEDLYYYKYPDDVIEKFKEGVKALKIAYVYAHRIDGLLSGDDGEESFLERLEQELKEIQDK